MVTVIPESPIADYVEDLQFIGSKNGNTLGTGAVIFGQGNKRWITPTSVSSNCSGDVHPSMNASVSGQPIFAADGNLSTTYFCSTLSPSPVLTFKFANKVRIEKVRSRSNAYLGGGSVTNYNEKNILAAKISSLTGIDINEILDNNLIVSTNFFWKELLRDDGFTIGRLDSRYKGIDSKDSGTYPEYPQELSSWDHAFTPAVNSYINEKLNFKTFTWKKRHYPNLGFLLVTTWISVPILSQTRLLVTPGASSIRGEGGLNFPKQITQVSPAHSCWLGSTVHPYSPGPNFQASQV